MRCSFPPQEGVMDADALLARVMDDVGLGGPLVAYIGRSDCPERRRQAAAALPQAIRHLYRRGEQIAAPDEELLELIVWVAEHGETSDRSLTMTWLLGHLVAAEHIRAAGMDQIDRELLFAELRGWIRGAFIDRRASSAS